MNWTSGALFTDEEGAAFDKKEAAEKVRLAALRENLLLPLVYIDVEIKVRS